jgi:hypothetical protein
VMNATNSMLWGFRLILWFGAIPILCMIVAHHYANRSLERQEYRQVSGRIPDPYQASLKL